MVFSPDGKTLAWSDESEDDVTLWDTTDWETHVTLKHSLIRTPTWSVYPASIDFSPDGRLIATGGGWCEGLHARGYSRRRHIHCADLSLECGMLGNSLCAWA